MILWNIKIKLTVATIQKGGLRRIRDDAQIGEDDERDVVAGELVGHDNVLANGDDCGAKQRAAPDFSVEPRVEQAAKLVRTVRQHYVVKVTLPHALDPGAATKAAVNDVPPNVRELYLERLVEPVRSAKLLHKFLKFEPWI